MTAQTVFRASIFLTVGAATLKIVGLAQVSWWRLLWPFWLAIPAHISLVAFIILAVIKMGPPPS